MFKNPPDAKKTGIRMILGGEESRVMLAAFHFLLTMSYAQTTVNDLGPIQMISSKFLKKNLLTIKCVLQHFVYALHLNI